MYPMCADNSLTIHITQERSILYSTHANYFNNINLKPKIHISYESYDNHRTSTSKQEQYDTKDQR